MATKQGIARMFAILRGAYPDQLQKQLSGFDLSKGTEEAMRQMMRFYMPYFEGMPDEVAIAAALSCTAKDSPWWPRVGELRAAAFNIMLGRAGIVPALEAWGMVMRHMDKPQTVFRNGRSLRLKSLPEIIEQAVGDTGGWTRLRNSNNATADRARFVEAYNARAQRALDTTRMLPQVREVAERFQIAAQEAAQLESGE